MNAVNPIPSSTSPGADGAEPSMEDILASIRKIIADDGAMPRLDGPRHHEREAGDVEADPAQEVSELESRDAAAHEPTIRMPTVDEPRGKPEIERAGAAPHAASSETLMAETADLSKHPLAPAPEVMGLGSVVHDEPAHGRSMSQSDSPAVDAAAGPERLFASAVDSSVTAAFNTLAASRFIDSSEQLAGLVREMIRPLVKAWVDENLPGMVERLVVAEIERMARGGR